MSHHWVSLDDPLILIRWKKEKTFSLQALHHAQRYKSQLCVHPPLPFSMIDGRWRTHLAASELPVWLWLCMKTPLMNSILAFLLNHSCLFVAVGRFHAYEHSRCGFAFVPEESFRYTAHLGSQMRNSFWRRNDGKTLKHVYLQGLHGQMIIYYGKGCACRIPGKYSA